MSSKKNRLLFWMALVIVGILSLFRTQISQSSPPSDDKVSHNSLNAGHELSDANAKGLMWFGISLFLGAIVMHVCLGVFFFRLRHTSSSSMLQSHSMNTEAHLINERALPPRPRLQVHPEMALKIYLERENHLLSTYGWIDQKAGIARIPIERAMELFEANSRKNP